MRPITTIVSQATRDDLNAWCFTACAHARVGKLGAARQALAIAEQIANRLGDDNRLKYARLVVALETKKQEGRFVAATEVNRTGPK